MMQRALSLLLVLSIWTPGCSDSPVVPPDSAVVTADSGLGADSAPTPDLPSLPGDASPGTDTGSSVVDATADADITAGADAGAVADASAAKPNVSIIPGCQGLTKESAYCIALVGMPMRLVMFGLDTGTICTGAQAMVSPGVASLGWLGDSVYVCEKKTATRIKVANGAMTNKLGSCDGLTEQGGGLLTMPFPNVTGGLTWYPTFSDLAANTKSKTYNIAHYASRLAAHKGNVYFAWHFTNEVHVGTLGVGGTTKLALKGYNGWIHGMDVTDTGLLVIGNTNKVHLFDAKTGAQKKTLTLTATPPIFTMHGLSCVSGVP